MTIAEAYLALGLAPHSDRRLVHATYRRLAMRYHPDRNSDTAGLARFKELATAYRVLRNKFRVDDAAPEQLHGECERCGQYALLHTALDGFRCCPACLGQMGRRPLLPAPPLVIVSCLATIILLSLAVCSLAIGVLSGASIYSMAAAILSLLALVSLGVTCLTVVYTAPPRRVPHSRARLG